MYGLNIVDQLTMWTFVVALCLLSASTVSGWTVGPPLCTKNSANNTLTSQLNIRLEPGETIGDLFGCVVNASKNGALDRVECDISVNETATENGQNVTYLMVKSTVNLNNVSDTLNGCGITETTVGGNRAFQSIIAVRRKANGLFLKNDTNYQWFCIETSATNLFVSTNVDVLTPDADVTLTPLLPTLTFQVLKQDSAASGGYSVATTCNLGQELVLEVIMDLPANTQYRNFTIPWGLTIFNTYFGPTQASVSTFSTSYSLISANGCTETNGLNFTQAFSRQSTSTQMRSVYRTGGGKCYKFGNSSQIWFSTYVDFCLGVYNEDTRCIDLCSHNTGRKKRAIEYDTQTLYCQLTVEEEKPEEESQTFMPLMIGLTVGVGVLLLVVVAIAIYVVCTKSRPRSRGRSTKSFSNLSTASSASSIPPKY